MTSRILILVTSLLFAFTTQAQPGSGQGGGMRMMNPEARVQELITALEITPQQEPAFREAMAKIAQQQGAAMQGMRQGGAGGGNGAANRNNNNADAHDHSGAGAGAGATDGHDHGGNGAGAGAQAGAGQGGGQGGGQGMARRAEMQAQAEAELTPILTAAQMAKYRELEAARMEEMRQRMMQRQQ